MSAPWPPRRLLTVLPLILWAGCTGGDNVDVVDTVAVDTPDTVDTVDTVVDTPVELTPEEQVTALLTPYLGTWTVTSEFTGCGDFFLTAYTMVIERQGPTDIHGIVDTNEFEFTCSADLERQRLACPDHIWVIEERVNDETCIWDAHDVTWFDPPVGDTMMVHRDGTKTVRPNGVGCQDCDGVLTSTAVRQPE